MGYSSPHSKSVSDRVVEPFLLMNNNNDVRCYELSSGMNKTFKVSRMQDVVMLDLEWEHEAAHKQVFTDLFMFSGEDKHHIRLRFDQLSHNLMQEEYPQSVPYMQQEDERHWIFETDVVSFLGIGRFVLGLYDNIQVLENDAFKDYLKKKIASMNTL